MVVGLCPHCMCTRVSRVSDHEVMHVPRHNEARVHDLQSGAALTGKKTVAPRGDTTPPPPSLTLPHAPGCLLMCPSVCLCVSVSVRLEVISLSPFFCVCFFSCIRFSTRVYSSLCDFLCLILSKYLPYLSLVCATLCICTIFSFLSMHSLSTVSHSHVFAQCSVLCVISRSVSVSVSCSCPCTCHGVCI